MQSTSSNQYFHHFSCVRGRIRWMYVLCSSESAIHSCLFCCLCLFVSGSWTDGRLLTAATSPPAMSMLQTATLTRWAAWVYSRKQTASSEAACFNAPVVSSLQLLIVPAVVGMALLHRLSDNGWERITAWVYGMGLCALFLVSTVFHIITWKKSHMRWGGAPWRNTRPVQAVLKTIYTQHGLHVYT